MQSWVLVVIIVCPGTLGPFVVLERLPYFGRIKLRNESSSVSSFYLLAFGP